MVSKGDIARKGGNASMNPLIQLCDQGQSVWLDYIRRDLMVSGALKRLIDDDGLRGLTSNPKIFMKAITESDEYDRQIETLISDDPGISVRDLYEALAIADVRTAADQMRPVFDRTEGADGFVSLEVSPDLAYNMEKSIAEARRLWKVVGRPNLMIKVPATDEGVAAIETLLAEGININVTLMFSMRHYDAVVRAYLRAMEKQEKPAGVSSVASFFVSRITRAVDAALDEVGGDDAEMLKGKIAIANAKVTYQRMRDIYSGDEFEGLKRRGVQVQRLLWGSTSTKNPDYSDVLYVEELVGPYTVNTMPPKTLEAFRDHGKVRGATILEDVEGARKQLGKLSELGIQLDEITERLQRDGVKRFQEPFNELLDALEKKRDDIRVS
jgi:transaldolase